MEFTVFPKVESFKAVQFDGSDEMADGIMVALFEIEHLSEEYVR